jgi:hypothetical protein
VTAAKEGDWRAGAWLFEGAYGKPEQRVEVEMPGTLAEIQAMTPEGRIAPRQRMLKQYPELTELVPRAECSAALRLDQPDVRLRAGAGDDVRHRVERRTARPSAR